MSTLSDMRNDLATLEKSLDLFREGQDVVKKKAGRPSVSSQEQEVENKQLGSLLGQFKDMIVTLVEKLDKYEHVTIPVSVSSANLEERVDNLERVTRVQEDNLDHHHQRSLKGKFF